MQHVIAFSFYLFFWGEFWPMFYLCSTKFSLSKACCIVVEILLKISHVCNFHNLRSIYNQCFWVCPKSKKQNKSICIPRLSNYTVVIYSDNFTCPKNKLVYHFRKNKLVYHFRLCNVQSGMNWKESQIVYHPFVNIEIELS